MAPFVLARTAPLGCAVISGRVRFGGRATVTVPPFAEAELGACFALLGGFLADMEGEGEDEAAAPFVWMPAGIGRFVLGWGGMTGGGMGVVLGAMATGALLQETAQCAAGEAPRAGAWCWCLVLGARCPVLVRSAWPASQAIETRFEGRGSIAFGQMEWYTAGILQARRQASEIGAFRFEMEPLTTGLWAVDCGLWDRRTLKESRAGRGQWARPTKPRPESRCDGDGDGDGWLDDGSGARVVSRW